MEQNPLTQSHVPHTDKKKVYISIIIILVLILGTIFVLRQFGDYKIKKQKEQMVQQLKDGKEPTIKEKLDISEIIIENTTTSAEEVNNKKQDLINKIKNQ